MKEKFYNYVPSDLFIYIYISNSGRIMLLISLLKVSSSYTSYDIK